MRYGEHAKQLLELADEFDDFVRERNTTHRFRRDWARDGRLVCAICGLDDAGQIEVAHLRALEEYGHTVDENLLPLCESTVDGKPRNGQALLSRLLDQYAGSNVSIGEAADEQGMRLGCHDLLDNGVIAKRRLGSDARQA